MKRYWLMKLVNFDINTKTETWKFLKIGSEKPHELNNFLVNGYRIYDNKDRVVVKTNLNIDEWLKMNEEPQK